MVARKLPEGVVTHQGLVAILDALGAASFNQQQILAFINARQELLRSTTLNAEEQLIEGKTGSPDATLKTFTFGDTLLIAYATPGDLASRFITRFFAIVRHLLAHSLGHQILFRGAIGIGEFYVDDDSNTVMGEAVADAAGWYEKADWLGAIATPRTALTIERLYGKKEPKPWAMLDYDVPLKGGQTLNLPCVNWPKMFMVSHLTPAKSANNPRQSFLDCLSAQPVPIGTESKYFNSLKFFDYSLKREAESGQTQNAKKKQR